MELMMHLGVNMDPSGTIVSKISALIALMRIVDQTTVINPRIDFQSPITPGKDLPKALTKLREYVKFFLTSFSFNRSGKGNVFGLFIYLLTLTWKS